MVAVLFFFIFFSVVFGDVFMHNPRGSNNRNRGNGANVANANRLFDSQNNGKGGYCWGPPMTYYSGSRLQIEWTDQHGCGEDHPKVHCDIILQYMCHNELRDGIVTQTINGNNKDEQQVDPKTGEKTWKFGMHEPHDYFEKCKQRPRNAGLFIADQDLGKDSKATRTRQENNDDPHGFECEEEKDYYPYWHPNPWRDIAVLTSDTDKCDYYQKNSENVVGKHECSKAKFNNEKDCTANKGDWHQTLPWGLPPPVCKGGEYNRVNHLGNALDGETSSYTWVIPSLQEIGRDSLSVGGIAKCVLRIRYNISTGDYEHFPKKKADGSWSIIDHKFNGDKSPIKQNPYFGYGTGKGGNEWHLSLALNTDQYARTFQDRSHMFQIKQRPAMYNDRRIHNLNVRGKRGNIVETFPATEYDFVPNDLRIGEKDVIHFQWTGCDTNPNYAGEGTQGTDRHNIVQIMPDENHNLPFTYEKGSDFSKDVTMFEPDVAFLMGHLNQYDGKVCKNNGEKNCCKIDVKNVDNADKQNCAKLNDPDRQYFDGGIRQLKPGSYFYMSTRNNNFTNRSQKGRITVVSGSQPNIPQPARQPTTPASTTPNTPEYAPQPARIPVPPANTR